TVSPPEGARVAGSTSTRGEVAFDAKMDTANPSSVLSVTGCAATIEQPKWDTEGSRLTFMLRLPGSPPGGVATVTVHNAAARASPDGFANELDGNADPDGESGVEPNSDDYTWHVSCSTGSTLS